MNILSQLYQITKKYFWAWLDEYRLTGAFWKAGLVQAFANFIMGPLDEIVLESVNQEQEDHGKKDETTERLNEKELSPDVKLKNSLAWALTEVEHEIKEFEWLVKKAERAGKEKEDAKQAVAAKQHDPYAEAQKKLDALMGTVEIPPAEVQPDMTLETLREELAMLGKEG